MSSLRDRFGSARRPDRAVVHVRPAGDEAGADDATVEAVGKISAAFEVVENARGMLYAFHRMSGEADLALQDGLAALRTAGHEELADEIDEVLVGRDVVRDMWTFQLVEAYDEQYWQVFREASALVRDELSAGLPHVFEAEMKRREQTAGSSDQPAVTRAVSERPENIQENTTPTTALDSESGPPRPYPSPHAGLPDPHRNPW